MDNSTDLLNFIFHTGLILTPFYLLYMLNKYNTKILNKHDLDNDSETDGTIYSDKAVNSEECSLSSSDSGLDSDDENESDEEDNNESNISSSDVLVSDISEKNINMVSLIKNKDQNNQDIYYLSNEKNPYTDSEKEKIHNKIKTILDELSEL